MNDSPRLIQQLRSDAQKREACRASGALDAHTPRVDCVVESAGFAADHTQTTHATGQKPHTAGSRHGGDKASTLHRQLDERLRLRLAQLEVLPGAISGKGLERTSQGVERPLPISWSGAAKGDVSVFVFRRRIAGAKSIRAKAGVLRDLNAAISEITVSRKRGRPEFDLSVKEGRIAAGRLAEEHGVKWACEALGVKHRMVMHRYRDEYRRTK